MKNHQKSSREKGLNLRIFEKGGKANRTCPKGAAVAEVGKQITFDPKILDTFDVKGWQPVHYDLLVISAAVEFADRHWKRPLGWSRTVNVTVPVLVPAIWWQEEVGESLCAALRDLTCDTWTFTFVQWQSDAPIGSRQGVLDFGKTKTFAMAYSEGLDSRAVAALSGDMDKALCIRVSKNRQHLKSGEAPFDQIPFKVQGHGSRESSFRSRGFQFAAVTAIAAHLAELTRIVVPESGQGALGPVLLSLHNVYRDYRNHPTFFRTMERFIKVLLKTEVRYEQPRLWHTKGQTLRAFLDLPGKIEEDLRNTHSCWQTRRVVNVRGRKHCGLCASCLLRRLSMHTAGIKEQAEAYVVSNLCAADVNDALSVIPRKEDRDIMIEYGSVGTRHLQDLADMAERPDDELRQHASEIAVATGATEEETLKNLRSLLVAHAEEWRAFLAAQGEKSFLKSWLEGGRYGRFE